MGSDTIQKVTRPAAYAGKFYPASGKTLQEEILSLTAEGKQAVFPDRQPRALVVPHAGYVFSGKVAASGYNQLSPDHVPEKVFILASCHHHSFPGISVFSSGNYETPLGQVEVDTETAKKLVKEHALFSIREEVHEYEHSLEVQLPFLQHKLGNHLRIVPLILGIRNPADCRLLAEALQPYFTDNHLFVISSDFSHYPDYKDAVTADRDTTEAILSNSPDKLLKTLDSNSKRKIPGLATSLCGWTSVLTLLYLTQGKNFSYHWIDYQNSGDQPLYGDHDRVVGYSAIAVFEEKIKDFSLTEAEKKILSDIADEAIRKFIMQGNREFSNEIPGTGNLSGDYGAFVSIYVKGKLRGCIGRFEGTGTLAQTVHEMAISSTSDRRFSPLIPEELNELTVEISVLSPLKKIESPAEIIPGRHGIYIRSGWSTGTFLPQVAVKYGWTVEEFLGRCARDKAGIGWDGWKTAELFVFEAIVFGNTQ